MCFLLNETFDVSSEIIFIAVSISRNIFIAVSSLSVRSIYVTIRQLEKLKIFKETKSQIL